LSKSKGFSLIELVMVLAIMGIMTTIVTLSISILDKGADSIVAIDKNVALISEMSVLSGQVIGWYASETHQELFYLDNKGQKINQVESKRLDSFWGAYSDYFIEVETFSGDVVRLNKFVTMYPLVVFYPTGANSGANIYFKSDVNEMSYRINQNGVTKLEYE